MACVFCDFISGKRKKNMNGWPFIMVHETKNTACFLSTDMPAHEDGHLLIIPKKHYADYENIPPKTLQEIMEHARTAIRITRRRHKGCNILLNDGKAAGQRVMHVHFHIIPRDPSDGIMIEKWKHAHTTQTAFEKLSLMLRKEFSRRAHQ